MCQIRIREKKKDLKGDDDGMPFKWELVTTEVEKCLSL